MKSATEETRYPLNSKILAKDLSAPLSIDVTYKTPYTSEVIAGTTKDLPETLGKVVERYVDKTNIVIDVRWGSYGIPGSVKATYVIPRK